MIKKLWIFDLICHLQLKPSSVYFTLVGAVSPWHGRTVQILVSLSSLQSGFLLVIREDTPIPQLREHWDQSVVWTGHFFSFRWSHSEECRRHERGWEKKKNLRHQYCFPNPGGQDPIKGLEGKFEGSQKD